MSCLHKTWLWLLEWWPYGVYEFSNFLLIIFGIWLSFEGVAKTVEKNKVYKRTLAVLCFLLGGIGMYVDAMARHDSDQSNKRLMENTNALVTEANTLIGTTNRLATNTTRLTQSANVMVNGLTDTNTKLRGMAASMQQTRRDLASQTEFLNHMDLHIVPVQEFAKKGLQLADTVQELDREYTWRINTGSTLGYNDRMESGRASQQELADLKRDMEKNQEALRREYQKEASKVMDQVRPICEELVRRLDASYRTERDKYWAAKFASQPADATGDMADLAVYLQELSRRVQRGRLTAP